MTAGTEGSVSVDRTAADPEAVPSEVRVRERRALGEIRRELAVSYPLIRPWRVSRISRRHGLRGFPAGLLLEGSAGLLGAGTRSLFRLFFASLRRRITHTHPLFSTLYYDLANPDVASSRVSSWLHYQVYGRAEGRSPHPLISLPLLGSQLSGVRIGDAVDEYLADRRWWSAEPSPYVDCARFILEGPWDSHTHPLEQIVRRHQTAPWVRVDLLLIDGSERDRPELQLAVAGLLLEHGAGRLGAGTVIERWREGTVPAPAGPGEMGLVVPGLLMGLSGVVRRLHEGATGLSGDGTVMSLPGQTMAVRIPEANPVELLVYCQGPIERKVLIDALQGAVGAVAVSPRSTQQQKALELLVSERGWANVRVLPSGRQTRVRFHHLATLPATGEIAAPPEETAASTPAGLTAIVVSAVEQDRLQSDPRLVALLGASARLCLVVDDDLSPWVTSLRQSSRIVASESVSDGVLLLIDTDLVSLTLLGQGW